MARTVRQQIGPRDDFSARRRSPQRRVVAAAPVDQGASGYRPDNQFLQLAEGLSKLEPGLRTYVERQRQKQAEEDIARAQADALQNPDAPLPVGSSEAYTEAYMETKGRVFGSRWMNEARAEYEQNKNDPDWDFSSWMQGKFSQSFGGKGHDPTFLTGALPRVREEMLRLEAAHTGHVAEMQQERATAEHYEAFTGGIENLAGDQLYAATQAFIEDGAEFFGLDRVAAGELAIQAIGNEAVRRGDMSLFDVFNIKGTNGVTISRHPRLSEIVEAEKNRADLAIRKIEAEDLQARKFDLFANLEKRGWVPLGELREHVDAGTLTAHEAMGIYRSKATAAAQAQNEAAENAYALQFPHLAAKPILIRALEAQLADQNKTLAARGQTPTADQQLQARINAYAQAGEPDPVLKQKLGRAAVSLAQHPESFKESARIYEMAKQTNSQYALQLVDERSRAIYDAYLRRTNEEGHDPATVISTMADAEERRPGVMSQLSKGETKGLINDAVRDLNISGHSQHYKQFVTMVEDAMLFGEAADAASAVELATERWESRQVEVGNAKVDVRYFGDAATAERANVAFNERYIPILRRELPAQTKDMDDDEFVLMEDQVTRRDGTLVVIDKHTGNYLGRVSAKALGALADDSVREQALEVARAARERMERNLNDPLFRGAQAGRLAEAQIAARGLDPEGPEAQAIYRYWMDEKNLREALKQGLHSTLPGGTPRSLDFTPEDENVQDMWNRMMNVTPPQ